MCLRFTKIYRVQLIIYLCVGYKGFGLILLKSLIRVRQRGITILAASSCIKSENDSLPVDVRH